METTFDFLITATTSSEAVTGRPMGQEELSSSLRKGVPDAGIERLDADSARLIAESCRELMREKRFAA